MSGSVSVLLQSEIDGSWSMYLMEDPEPSLVASEPRLSHLDGDELLDGSIMLMEEVFDLLEDRGDTSTREARANGLWKQNILLVMVEPRR